MRIKTGSSIWNSRYSSFLPETYASKITRVELNDRYLTKVSNYCFYGSNYANSFSNLTEVKDIASTVTTIGSYAFYACKNLTSVSFPRSTSIGASAFYQCYNLTSISIPRVTFIDSSAFWNCPNLTSVSFPNATTIDAWAFAHCYGLTTALFPNVTSICSYAFYSCSRLTNIYILGSSIPTLVASNAFTGCSSTYQIFVKESMYDSFITAPVWSTLTASRFAIYSFDI